jgi:hypothetical protein
MSIPIMPIIPVPAFGYGRCNSSSIHTRSSYNAQNHTSQHQTMANDTVPHNEAREVPLSDLEAGRRYDTYMVMPPPSYSTRSYPRPPSYNSPQHHSAACDNSRPHVNHQQTSTRPRPQLRKLSRRCRCGDLCRKFAHSKICAVALVLVIIVLFAIVIGAIGRGLTRYHEQRQAHSGSGGSAVICIGCKAQYKWRGVYASRLRMVELGG